MFQMAYYFRPQNWPVNDIMSDDGSNSKAAILANILNFMADFGLFVVFLVYSLVFQSSLPLKMMIG